MLNLRTPSPTFATTPEVSCPKMRGAEWDPLEIFFRSVPQIPQVWTRTRISPGPISGTGTSSMRTSFTPRYTAACMVEGILCLSLSTVFSTASVDVRAIAIADLTVSPIAPIQPPMTQATKPDDLASHDRGNSRAHCKEPGLPWHCSAPGQ